MKTTPTLSRSQRGFGFAPGSLVLLVASFAVFLLFRPYQGIIHDARLYVGYALAALDPDGIGRDIVFLNDGQSGFSAYPLMMRHLAELIGPSRAAMLLTYGGLLGWFAAFAALVRRLLGERFSDGQVIMVIVLAASLPSFYGGQGVFRFAEHFATPRALAEACVLAAFAALLARRTRWAVFAFALGLAFHPLMTAPGIGVALWFCAETPRTRTLLAGAAAGGTVLLLAGSALVDGVGKPFARFDAEWMAALNTKHALVFLHTWRAGDAIRILLHLVTAALALPALTAGPRRLVRSTLFVVVAGVLVSALGSDVAANVLVTQVQAWRGLWMLAVLATVLQGVLLLTAWSREDDHSGLSTARDLQRVASLLLLLAWFMVEINSTALAFSVLAAMLWNLPRLHAGIALPPTGVPIVGAVTLLLVVAVVAVQAWVTMSTAWSSPDTSMHWAWNNIVATGGPALLVLLGVSGATGSRRFAAIATARVRAQLFAAGLVIVTILVIDSRSAYQRHVETELDARAKGVPAPVHVPQGGTVLWPYADMEPWAFAGAPGWGTIVQGMPSVFDRELAIAWARRTKRLEQAGLLPVGQTGAETIAEIDASIDGNVVRALCAAPDNPAVIVLPGRHANGLELATVMPVRVPRVLFPSAMGRPWGLIREYSLVYCRARSA